MSEDKKPETKEETSSDPQSKDSQDSASAVAEGYIGHVKEVLTQPDDHFSDDSKASRNYGLISAGLFLGLVFVFNVITQMTRFTSWRFEFGFLISSFRVVLALGVPIVATVFVLRWLEGRSGTARSTDFYIGRFGAMLILPTLLVAVGIPLNLLDVALQGWFYGAALIFTYISVFMLSYLYGAQGKLQMAVLMAVGFYFAYRLLRMLL